MNYLDIGYNPLLTREAASNKITSGNIDAAIEAGAVSYNQTSLNIISGNQTLRSSNFVGGQTGWIIRGDGTAEFQSLAAKEFARVYSQDDPPTGDLNRGDIWYDTNDGNTRYIYDGSNWVEDKTDSNWSGIVDDDGHKPADNATVGATIGSDLYGGSTSSNYINSDGYLTAISADRITSGTIDISYTEAKCTDPNADETSSNTAADTAKVQGFTIIEGGYIKADYITADNITAGTMNAARINGGDINGVTITGVTITGGTIYAKNGSTTTASLSSGGLKIYGEYATWYSGSTAVGQIYASSTSSLQIYAYSGKDLEIGAGGAVTINGGGDDVEIRTENDAHIRCEYDSQYGGYCGNSSKVFSYMYATTYYFARSGETTRYIQMGTSGTIECSGSFYVGGTLSKAAGSFRINHPLKPDTHYLQHSFVESPDMMNLYSGRGEIINGEATISMPDWFLPLNGNDKNDFTYQLTPIGIAASLYIKREINGDGVVIIGSNTDCKFSYTISGIRHDEYAEKNRIKVEIKK